MAEFLQNYGIWIALIGGMYLMHRLGLGCCGGHGHGRDHGHGEVPKAEPKPTEVKAAAEKQSEAAAASPPRQGSCH